MSARARVTRICCGLFALQRAELAQQRLAQRAADHRIAFERIERFNQRLRQQSDAALAHLRNGQREQIVVAFHARIELAVDAVEPGSDEPGQ